MEFGLVDRASHAFTALIVHERIFQAASTQLFEFPDTAYTLRLCRVDLSEDETVKLVINISPSQDSEDFVGLVSLNIRSN